MNSPPNYTSLYPDEPPLYVDSFPSEVTIYSNNMQDTTYHLNNIPFWLFFFGFFFPLFWVIGAMYILSPIRVEVLWGEVNLFILSFTVLTGSVVIFGINYINSSS